MPHQGGLHERIFPNKLLGVSCEGMCEVSLYQQPVLRAHHGPAPFTAYGVRSVQGHDVWEAAQRWVSTGRHGAPGDYRGLCRGQRNLSSGERPNFCWSHKAAWCQWKGTKAFSPGKLQQSYHGSPTIKPACRTVQEHMREPCKEGQHCA